MQSAVLIRQGIYIKSTRNQIKVKDGERSGRQSRLTLVGEGQPTIYRPKFNEGYACIHTYVRSGDELLHYKVIINLLAQRYPFLI